MEGTTIITSNRTTIIIRKEEWGTSSTVRSLKGKLSIVNRISMASIRRYIKKANITTMRVLTNQAIDKCITKRDTSSTNTTKSLQSITKIMSSRRVGRSSLNSTKKAKRIIDKRNKLRSQVLRHRLSKSLKGMKSYLLSQQSPSQMLVKANNIFSRIIAS